MVQYSVGRIHKTTFQDQKSFSELKYENLLTLTNKNFKIKKISTNKWNRQRLQIVQVPNVFRHVKISIFCNTIFEKVNVFTNWKLFSSMLCVFVTNFLRIFTGAAEKFLYRLLKSVLLTKTHLYFEKNEKLSHGFFGCSFLVLFKI